jgi:hypothetical protein
MRVGAWARLHMKWPRRERDRPRPPRLESRVDKGPVRERKSLRWLSDRQNLLYFTPLLTFGQGCLFELDRKRWLLGESEELHKGICG